MRYINGKGRELFLSQTPAGYGVNNTSSKTQTGTAKNEAFDGSGGNTLVGGGGDDTYRLWDNLSTVKERPGEGIDTMEVHYWGPATLADNVENLILASPGATSGTGNSLDNILIAGSAGATLDGKAGDDVLVGGDGADVFKVSAGNGSDAILNFKPGSDAIVLSGYGVGTYDQLLKVAQQVASDVVLKFANGETLAIRDVQLSNLTAYDFGMKPAAVQDPGTVALVGAGQCNTYYGWYVLNNVWNPGTLKQGIDYTIDSSYHRADLTGGTTFNWSFPLVTEAYPTIRAYPEVIFGPSPHGGGAKSTDIGGVFPIRLDALDKLVATYDVSIQGNAGGFNVAYDIWFTNKPNGDASTITTELMVWMHKGNLSPFGQVVGTYTDGDISAKIYFNPSPSGNYIAVVLDDDRLKGQFDIAKLVDKLQDLGLMSASEYLASIELGSEVSSGAGSLKINNLDFSVVAHGNDGSSTAWQVDGSGVTKTLIQNNGGDDRFTYDPAKAILDGGAGNDTLVLTDSRTVDLSNGTSQVVGKTQVLGFENVDASGASGGVTVTGSQSGNNITGSAFADKLTGGAGKDVIDGGAGNDIIDGGAGADRLSGGNGDDRIVYDRNDYAIDGGAGRDTLVLKQGAIVDLGHFSTSQVDGGGAYVGGFEDVDASGASGAVTVTASEWGNNIIGSAFADKLTGGAGYDTINGGAGNDIIDGGASADRLSGGSGDDRIVYDRTDYAIDGGDGRDTLVLKQGATVDLGRFSSSQVDGGGAYVGGFEDVDASGASGAVTVTGSQWGNNITGSAFADKLTGGAGYDTINGGAGNDIIDGGAGADRLSGGSGDDRIVYDRTDYAIDGGDGRDTLVLKQGATVDLGRFSSSQVDGGGAYVGGFEDVDASGAAGVVKIAGSQYDNKIVGSAFNDILSGGGGYDVLTGGAGRDTFVFDNLPKSSGFATITDFAVGQDTLAIDGDFLGLAHGTLSASAFHEGTKATTPDEKIIYDANTGQLFFDADGSGNASGLVHIATLTGNPALDHHSFQII